MNIIYAKLTTLLVLLASATTSADDCKGCASLDEYNFDKITSRFKLSVVKFDVAYPYGDKHTVFTKLAEEVSTNKDILIAQVGIKDYGDKENEELAKKYGVKNRDDLPVILLMTEKNKEPVFYTGNWDLDNLRTFIKTNSDVYIGLPGCLEEYDKIASKFVVSSNKEEVVKDAEKLLEKETDDKAGAGTYIKYMKKIVEQGTDFVQHEMARLNKIIKDGKINDKKKEELSHRVNILHSFSVVSKDEL
ncbi:hypothetical protein RN001_010815 [Aquatica leii]|uniref:Endoplasmic reticulum resident protein 29 n=1 Tax=Aquatica leii TaxID=1421715 RepID=A0AAN7SGA7_9COLE|nr:hypothetical protein RN001_010815 [Aquatica leii]